MEIVYKKPGTDKEWAQDALEIFRLNDIVDDLASEEFMKLFGFDPESPDDLMNCPWERITYDWYDSSFELKDAKDGLTLTNEQQAICGQWGFAQCWICYENGGEVYYSFQKG